MCERFCTEIFSVHNSSHISEQFCKKKNCKIQIFVDNSSQINFQFLYKIGTIDSKIFATKLFKLFQIFRTKLVQLMRKLLYEIFQISSTKLVLLMGKFLYKFFQIFGTKLVPSMGKFLYEIFQIFSNFSYKIGTINGKILVRKFCSYKIAHTCVRNFVRKFCSYEIGNTCVRNFIRKFCSYELNYSHICEEFCTESFFVQNRSYICEELCTKNLTKFKFSFKISSKKFFNFYTKLIPSIVRCL